jgi:hypothetical protein
MDREGIYAARSVREIGAKGEDKAGGSNAQKPPAGPESLLDVQPDNGIFNCLSVRRASSQSQPDRPSRIRAFRHWNFTNLPTSLLRFPS